MKINLVNQVHTLLYVLGRRLPSKLKNTILSPFVRVFKNELGVPLFGPLTGFYMAGNIPDRYRDGTYETESIRVVQLLVESSWKCVDVGAHIGYYTLLFAKLVGKTGQVWAFEAWPENARRLMINVALNHFKDRVIVENKAVWNKSHKNVSLYPGRKGSDFEWNIVGHDVLGTPTQEMNSVGMVTLDDYFGDEHIDFIKMDIEGAESKALVGAKQLLSCSQPLLLVEFHGHEGWHGAKILFELDYTLYDIRDKRWLTDVSEEYRIRQILSVPKASQAKVQELLSELSAGSFS